MSKFAIKTIEPVRGNYQQVKQLVILDDNVDADKIQAEINKNELEKKAAGIEGILDIYESSLEIKYQSAFRGIISIMNRGANGQIISKDKFKEVTPKNESVKEYEFKFQDLRVYAIKIPHGKLILSGGFKNQQKKDFSKFRSVKRKYLESIQSK